MTFSEPHRPDVANAEGARLVEDCDIPEGMTISEWRRACAAARLASEGAPRRRVRLRRLVRRHRSA